jgi:CRISPR system Cascade subunit CasA
LLSIQSRRLALVREHGVVRGYRLLGGDFFSKNDAFSEQMTMWRWNKEEKAFVPKRHDGGKQLWRDFTALTISSDEKQRPGIVDWISFLKDKDALPEDFISFGAANVLYGDKDFFVNDTFSDAVRFNAALLGTLASEWLPRIESAIATTDECVKAVGHLAKNLAIASGKEGEKEVYYKLMDAAKERAYFSLDIPFRQWLEALDPVFNEPDERKIEWYERMEMLLRELGNRMVAEAGTKAIVGNLRQTAASAYVNFERSLRKELRIVQTADEGGVNE